MCKVGPEPSPEARRREHILRAEDTPSFVGSVRLVWKPFVFVLMNAAVCISCVVEFREHVCESLEDAIGFLPFEVMTVTLLVAFRMSRALDLHAEAVRAHGVMATHVRDLVRASTLMARSNRDRVCTLAKAFPMSLIRDGDFRRMTEGLDVPFDPSAILQELLSEIQDAPPALFDGMMVSIRGMGEALARRPAPPTVYVSQLRAGVYATLACVPILGACTWEWLTLLLTFAVAVSLFGMEAVALECERQPRRDLCEVAALLSEEING